jgi:hypothetical protein
MHSDIEPFYPDGDKDFEPLTCSSEVQIFCRGRDDGKRGHACHDDEYFAADRRIYLAGYQIGREARIRILSRAAALNYNLWRMQ